MKKAMQFLAALVLFGAIVCVFWPMVNRTQLPQRSRCQSHLKQIALACKQYLQDHDGRLPMISNGNQGWASSIQPYLKTWQIFQCPIGNNPVEKHTTDYFLSAPVAGIPVTQLKFPNQTISFGEGLDNAAVNSHFSELPFDWKSDEDSPAQRHLGGANYAFVDGHVKWILPAKISTQAPSKNHANWKPTFAVR